MKKIPQNRLLFEQNSPQYLNLFDWFFTQLETIRLVVHILITNFMLLLACSDKNAYFLFIGFRGLKECNEF